VQLLLHVALPVKDFDWVSADTQAARLTASIKSELKREISLVVDASRVDFDSFLSVSICWSRQASQDQLIQAVLNCCRSCLFQGNLSEVFVQTGSEFGVFAIWSYRKSNPQDEEFKNNQHQLTGEQSPSIDNTVNRSQTVSDSETLDGTNDTLLETIDETSQFRSTEKSWTTSPKHGMVPNHMEQSAALLAKVQTSLNEQNNRITELLTAEVEGFRDLVAKCSGIKFPASEQGYQDSFGLIDRIQERAFQFGQVFGLNSEPVFIVRNQPHCSLNEITTFSIFRISNSMRVIGRTIEIPHFELLTQVDSVINGQLQVARHRAIESLRLRLLQCEKKEFPSAVAAKAFQQEVNKLKTSLSIKFGYIGENSNFELVRVNLSISGRTFRLLFGAQNEELDSSIFFPKIKIIAT